MKVVDNSQEDVKLSTQAAQLEFVLRLGRGSFSGCFPPFVSGGEPQAELYYNGDQVNTIIQELVTNVIRDLDQNISPEAIVAYRSSQLECQLDAKPHRVGLQAKLRALRPDRPGSISQDICKLRTATADEVFMALQEWGNAWSWTSLASALYPGSKSQRGNTMAKWALGLGPKPAVRSVELVRQFLIELAQGKHQDILKPAGQNRKYKTK